VAEDPHGAEERRTSGGTSSRRGVAERQRVNTTSLVVGGSSEPRIGSYVSVSQALTNVELAPGPVLSSLNFPQKSGAAGGSSTVLVSTPAAFRGGRCTRFRG